MPFFEKIVEDRGATFGDAIGSPTSQIGSGISMPFRYELWRTWELGKPIMLLIMLNPSLADDWANDRTINRCIEFAKRMGFGGIRVVNLFAYRAQKPTAMNTYADPIGPRNDEFIRRNAMHVHCQGEKQGKVVAAWGAPHAFPAGRSDKIKRRAEIVAEMVQDLGVPLHVLGLTETKHPRHPIYLPNTSRLTRWIALYD